MIPFIGIYAQSIYYVSPHASSGGDGSQSAFSFNSRSCRKAPERIKIALHLLAGGKVLDKPLMLTSDDGNDSE